MERRLEVNTPDGSAECFFVCPGENGSWPAVIMWPDIGGIRPTSEDMARRLAGEGFCVLLPNPFYRASRLPVYKDPFKFGEEKTTARMGEVRAAVTGAGSAKDAVTFTDWLLSQKQVKGPKIGTVGYCMGGGQALRTAAAEPDKVGAAVTFHGSQLASDAPDSPHLLAPKIKARLHVGFAIEDRTMPPEACAKLETALKDAQVSYDAEIYEGAKHGWCVKDHTVYNQPQAERAWKKMVAVFKAALG